MVQVTAVLTPFFRRVNAQAFGKVPAAAVIRTSKLETVPLVWTGTWTADSVAFATENMPMKLVAPFAMAAPLVPPMSSGMAPEASLAVVIWLSAIFAVVIALLAIVRFPLALIVASPP